MTHYEKLATLMLRVFALVGFLFSLIGFGYAILYRIGENEYSIQAADSFYASIFYFIISIALFVLSKIIAKLICKGF